MKAAKQDLSSEALMELLRKPASILIEEKQQVDAGPQPQTIEQSEQKHSVSTATETKNADVQKSETGNNKIQKNIILDNDLLNDPTIQAALELKRIHELRGQKKRFDFFLPNRVGEHLAAEAKGRGVTPAVRLMEILRDAGYPVIEEDLLDMRKHQVKVR